MNPYLIGGVVGVALGSGCTFLIFKEKFKRDFKKEQEAFDADLEEMKQYYEERYHARKVTAKIKENIVEKDVPEEIISGYGPEVVGSVKVKQETDDTPRLVSEMFMRKDEQSRYHNAYSKTHELVSKMDGIDMDRIKNNPKDNPRENPQIAKIITQNGVVLNYDPDIPEDKLEELIMDPNLFPADEIVEEKRVYMSTKEEYDASEFGYYAKTSLNYYGGDDTLVYEELGDPEVLVDMEQYVGEYGLQLLRDWYGDETQMRVDCGDSMYIRNAIRDTYYEVMYFDESYYEAR